MTNESESTTASNHAVSNNNNGSTTNNNIPAEQPPIPAIKVPFEASAIVPADVSPRQPENTNGHNPIANQETDIQLTIESLIEQVESGAGETQTPACLANGSSSPEAQTETGDSATKRPEREAAASSGVPRAPAPEASVQDVEMDEAQEEPKDIVTLRNLEITPPPGSTPTQTPALGAPADVTESKSGDTKRDNKKSKKKRPIEATVTNEGETKPDEGRSKRQRTQTQLFQVGSTPASTTRSSKSSRSSTASGSITSSPAPTARRRSNTHSKKRKSSTASNARESSESPEANNSRHIQYQNLPHDVIFYEKNDYLAIRNEEDHFFLGQLTENVRTSRPFVKVKWLDTSDGGKTYFLTPDHDVIPSKSIIMPVTLIKLKQDRKGDQLFALDDQVRDGVMERLKRSLNMPVETQSSQEQMPDEEN